MRSIDASVRKKRLWFKATSTKGNEARCSRNHASNSCTVLTMITYNEKPQLVTYETNRHASHTVGPYPGDIEKYMTPAEGMSLAASIINLVAGGLPSIQTCDRSTRVTVLDFICLVKISCTRAISHDEVFSVISRFKKIVTTGSYCECVANK